MMDGCSRRMLLLGGMAAVLSGCANTRQLAPQPAPGRANRIEIDPQFRRQRVPYAGGEKPGTIIVNRDERFLYYVEGDGWATRYGVGVGKEGRTLSGRAVVGRKAEWPSWTPTANMMRREPRYLQYAGGVSGGPHNPLGARALYLYRNGRDTMYRLHGTNEPWSIGQAVSSGCIRLLNDDIIHLYERVPVGTAVMII
mgnify:CR=1 FL=1